MDGRWTESGKPRPIPNEPVERQTRYRFVSPLTQGWLCADCGALIGDTTIHDHFHAA